MDLALSEEQDLLRQGARRFLSEASPSSLVRQMTEHPTGMSDSLWQEMAGLGWTGLLIPETFGGAGGSVLDAVVLFEQVGQFLPPAPLFTSGVLSALVVLHCGSDQQKAGILPAIAEGREIVSLAFTEQTASWDPSAVQTRLEQRGDRYAINGQKLFVPDAHIAGRLLVVCRVGDGAKDLRVALVDPKADGVHLVALDTIGSDRQFAITFTNVAVGANALLPGGWPALQAAIQRATVVKCAEMLGGSERALEMSVAYAKERVAFGRPIGSFQAIQHICAEVLTKIDGLRVLVYETSWLLDNDLPAGLEVALCKDFAGEVFREATTEGHQIHAGLAYTLDHDMHLFHRRVPAAEAMFGDGDYHKEIAAQYLRL